MMGSQEWILCMMVCILWIYPQPTNVANKALGWDSLLKMYNVNLGLINPPPLPPPQLFSGNNSIKVV